MMEVICHSTMPALPFNTALVLSLIICGLANPTMNRPVFRIQEESPKYTTVSKILDNNEVREWVASVLDLKQLRVLEGPKNFSFSMTSNYFIIDSTNSLILTTSSIDREAILFRKYTADAHDRFQCEESREENDKSGKTIGAKIPPIIDCFIETNLNIIYKTQHEKESKTSLATTFLRIYVDGMH